MVRGSFSCCKQGGDILISMNKKNIFSIKRTIGVIAALFGLASGFLYQRHIAVEAWDRSDVSEVVGFYFFLASGLMWFIFLIVHFCVRPKS